MGDLLGDWLGDSEPNDRHIKWLQRYLVGVSGFSTLGATEEDAAFTTLKYTQQSTVLIRRHAAGVESQIASEKCGCVAARLR